MNVIMKFGGTSVADAEAMTRVINIVRDHIARHPRHSLPVVVVSAMSKVTDRLIESGRLAGQGAGEQAAQLVQDLLDRHVAVASALVPAEASKALLTKLAEEFAQLTATVRRLAEAS